MHSIDRFESYLKHEKRCSVHTLKAYLSDLEQFTSFIQAEYDKDQSISTSSHKQIRTWIVYLLDDQDLNTASVNRKISALKTYFRFVKKEGIREDNPMQKVISPRQKKRLPEFVEEKGMHQLFDEITFSNDFEGQRNKLILQTLYFTGIRLSELIGIKIRDIDFYQGYLTVLGKRNKERQLPLTMPMLNEVKSYLESRDELEVIQDQEFLFLTAKGRQIYPSLVYDIVKTNLNLVTTIKKKSPHVIRHSFATHMLNNGADLHTIKELLGHANLAATQVYTHNTFEKLKSIYNQAHPRA